MISLGTAQLIQGPHEGTPGILVWYWDLRPFGEGLAFVGPKRPGPELNGFTRDFGKVRLDMGTGAAFALEQGDPAPSTPVPGMAAKVPLGLKGSTMIVIGVIAYLLATGSRFASGRR